MRLTDDQIDAIATKYAGMGGIEDYRALARDIALLAHEACATACDEIALKHQQTDGSYAAGKKAGAFECAEALRAI